MVAYVAFSRAKSKLDVFVQIAETPEQRKRKGFYNTINMVLHSILQSSSFIYLSVLSQTVNLLFQEKLLRMEKDLMVSHYAWVKSGQCKV